LGHRINDKCSLPGVPEVERETEVESEEDLEAETGGAQGVEAGAGDPALPVLAIKARKLRIGNVTIGLSLLCMLGTDSLPWVCSPSNFLINNY
jgi:hypothetical protein